MKLKVSEFEIKKLEADGNHIYLKGTAEYQGLKRQVEIFFRDILEEKKVFKEAEMTLNGELIEADGGTSFLNTEVIHATLKTDFPLDGLSIKDRLNATGLIHEFRDIFRKDKIRAREILKVVGVSEDYAEEILLRNSYILPFI